MSLRHSLLGLAMAGAFEQMKAPSPRSFYFGTRDTAPKLGPYQTNAKPRRERRDEWRKRIFEARGIRSMAAMGLFKSDGAPRPSKRTMPWHSSGLTMSGTNSRGH